MADELHVDFRDPLTAELVQLQRRFHAASWTVCERGDRPAGITDDVLERWRWLYAVGETVERGVGENKVGAARAFGANAAVRPGRHRWAGRRGSDYEPPLSPS